MPELGVSDAAVKKATGKDWQAWFKILDKAGAKRMPHKEIARLLADKKYIESSWWCQAVTVGYEKARGKRVLGQTASAGFEVGVQKTLPIEAEAAWKLLMSNRGLRIWMGEIRDFKPLAGYGYRTKAGINGEIRTVNLGQKLRISWKRPEWRNTSTLQITLLPLSGKTALHIHQEKLADASQRTDMRKHWGLILDRLVKAAG